MEEVLKYNQHIDSLCICKSFSSNDVKGLVIGASNLEGNIWDGSIGLIYNKKGKTNVFKQLPAGVTSVRIADSDNMLVLVGRDDGIVSIHSTQTLDEIHSIDAHEDIISMVQYDHQNRGIFASSSWDGCISWWDYSRGQCVQKINAHYGHVNDFSFCSKNTHMLSSVGQDGFLRIWDKRVGINCVQLYDLGQAGSCCLWDTINDNNIIVGADSGLLSFWDFRSGKDNSGMDVSPPNINLHKTRIRRIIQIPEKNMIVTASDDTTITLLGQGYEVISRFAEHSDYVTDIVYDENQFLYTSSTDKTLKCIKM